MYNTITLPNGLRVIHLPSESPVVYCGYQIKAGTRNEKPGQEGLAHFVEHTTFKGTRKLKAWQILNCLERVGGELNAYTNKEETVYYAAILRDDFQRAVDLLTDIVFHSVYPQAEIDKEVEVICDEIESYHDSPSELIYDEFENIIFSGRPLGHNILGTAEKVRSFTTEDALQFTRTFYTPDNAVFFMKCPTSSLKPTLNKLARLTGPQAPRTAATLAPSLPHSPLCGQVNVSQRGTHQAHVMMGTEAYEYRHPLRMALYLLNNILGGPGMNARLNVILRERHGLVYTVESNMTAYTDTGLWTIYFGCDPHDVDRCIRLVRHQLDRFMNTPLTARQLEQAKRQLKGQAGIGNDNREATALGMGKTFLHYGFANTLEDFNRQVDAVTSEQIQQVAQQLFAPKRITTLIYK